MCLFFEFPFPRILDPQHFAPHFRTLPGSRLYKLNVGINLWCDRRKSGRCRRRCEERINHCQRTRQIQSAVQCNHTKDVLASGGYQHHPHFSRRHRIDHSLYNCKVWGGWRPTINCFLWLRDCFNVIISLHHRQKTSCRLVYGSCLSIVRAIMGSFVFLASLLRLICHLSWVSDTRPSNPNGNFGAFDRHEFMSICGYNARIFCCLFTTDARRRPAQTAIHLLFGICQHHHSSALLNLHCETCTCRFQHARCQTVSAQFTGCLGVIARIHDAFPQPLQCNGCLHTVAPPLSQAYVSNNIHICRRPNGTIFNVWCGRILHFLAVV